MKTVPIHSDAELFRCLIFQTPIHIHFADGTFYPSIINGFDDDLIYVDGGFEFRSNISLCRKEFRYDADLENCVWFQTPVELRVEDQIQDVATRLNAIMDDIILVDGAYYFRSNTVVLAA
ncbi:hypothetical protein SAMN04487897_1694 [Paenibacillus sp. yr247]|uniref:hypothetical protein n=1 Tax=Paenibacillus sp. yr247 TaxID=1761880 RepID=UPI0008864C5D|nr:hypothetical protein [Paenibacillus sp. yr247]SDP29714.1 hypothetical protein SAMN04487897_1694 [Paenibacillus sp. yr247]